MKHFLYRSLLVITLFTAFIPNHITAYEVSLGKGSQINIPEDWIPAENKDNLFTWYSADYRAVVDAARWEPGTWQNLEEFARNIKPEGASGDFVSFPCWDGNAALADWTFESSGKKLRGWVLMFLNEDYGINISSFCKEKNFQELQPFLLSALDSFIPSQKWALIPGAVSCFLELSSPDYEEADKTFTSLFDGKEISWQVNQAALTTTQDVIEREALVLASYAGNEEAFYRAWTRYYRLIYRDCYSRMETLAEALFSGPLKSAEKEDAAVKILEWLQGFTYGSTESLSGLLSPAAACAEETGDCDSLALAYLMLMSRSGVEGRFLLTHQKHHAIAAVKVKGKGFHYVDKDGQWLTAELTTALPLGTLPERLNGVSDWFAINLSGR